MELLRSGDTEGLERMVTETPVVVRLIQGRLWDVDSEVRRHAAHALGAAAAADLELGRELLRRALWSLNDESATNGAYFLPAIGEIGRQAPELVAPFIGPMTAYLWDDGLRLGILRALCRIAEVAPNLLDDVQGRLQEISKTDDLETRECVLRLLAGNWESANEG